MGKVLKRLRGGKENIANANARNLNGSTAASTQAKIVSCPICNVDGFSPVELGLHVTECADKIENATNNEEYDDGNRSDFSEELVVTQRKTSKIFHEKEESDINMRFDVDIDSEEEFIEIPKYISKFSQATKNRQVEEKTDSAEIEQPVAAKRKISRTSKGNGRVSSRRSQTATSAEPSLSEELLVATIPLSGEGALLDTGVQKNVHAKHHLVSPAPKKIISKKKNLTKNNQKSRKRNVRCDSEPPLHGKEYSKEGVDIGSDTCMEIGGYDILAKAKGESVGDREVPESDAKIKKKGTKISESAQKCESQDARQKKKKRHSTGTISEKRSKKKKRTSIHSAETTDHCTEFVAMTNFAPGDVDWIEQMIQTDDLGGRFSLQDRVTPNTTHVIAGTDPCRRTMNVLRAIVYGCWLVSKNWVFKSHVMGKWQLETEFELQEEYPAAMNERLERELCQEEHKVYKNKLFHGHRFCITSRQTTPPQMDLEELILACSGEIVAEKSQSTIYITASGRSSHKTASYHIVSVKWVLDSIERNELQCFIGARSKSPEL
eukprot:CFRG8442T1